MRTNWTDTNNAFRWMVEDVENTDTDTIVRERVLQTQTAHSKISVGLQEVSKELLAARKELRRLKSCQHEKLLPTKMTQTRLERRSHRPQGEACSDGPHLRLLQEAKQLEETKQLINQKTRETEEVVTNLESNKAALEREQKVKKVTLNIDKNKCLPLRAIFKFDISSKTFRK